MMSDAQAAASHRGSSLASNSSQDADSLSWGDLSELSPWELATKTRDTEHAKLLLAEYVAHLNAGGDDGNPPLTQLDPDNYQEVFFAAIGTWRWKVLDLILATLDIDVNATDAGGSTALHVAASRNDTYAVGLLLKADGIDINKEDRSGLTALDRALAQRHESVVEQLLPRKDLVWGANLGEAIREAARDGHGDALDSLLDTECASVGHVLNPLSWSACRGQIEVLQVLLSRDGANVNAIDRLGRTPLSWAAQCGRADAVEFLLSHGADANVRGPGIYRYTALRLALREKQEEVVKKLVPVDTTTLHIVVMDEALEELRFMLRYKPDLDQRDHDDQTALHIAAQKGVFDIAKTLISAGADIDVKDDSGMTPLRTALKYHHTDLVQEVLKRRVDTTEITSQEWRRVSDERDVALLCKDLDGEQHLEFPGEDFDIREFAKKRLYTETFLLLMPDDTNSPAWTRAFGLVSDNRELTANNLQIYCSAKFQIPYAVALWLPLDQFSSDRPSGYRRGEASKIMWHREHLCAGLKQDLYLSTLPSGRMPDNRVDLFHQFLTYTQTQWLELCRRAGECLSQRRFDQLKAQGRSPETMNDLAKHAQKLAGLRLSLAGQVSKAKELMEYPSMKSASSDSREELMTFLEQGFEYGIKKKLDELDQIARDLLQIEFAWSSIHEARIATKLGQNVMLLTYVSIFYMPLGFCAALWAIPNIADISTRLPFIVTAFCVSLLTLLVTFNMERIAAWSQEGYQYCKSIRPSDLPAKIRTNLPKKVPRDILKAPRDLLKAPRELLERISQRIERKKTQDPNHP